MRTGWYPFAIARDGALSYLTVGISPLTARPWNRCVIPAWICILTWAVRRG